MGVDIANATCGTCGRVIGKLESPFVWKEAVVCHECHGILERQQTPIAKPIIDYANPPQPIPKPRYEAVPIPERFADNLVAPRWICLIGSVACTIAGAMQLGTLLFNLDRPRRCVSHQEVKLEGPQSGAMKIWEQHHGSEHRK